METINIHEAKTHLSRLLARVHAGEEVIISKSGKPYAKLVPIDLATKRKPGIAKGKVTADFFEPLPEEELDAWES
ncbi:type II toxin-antitoxin system Phd/YefM family antitoxin [Pelovirga terrestris]|uniref:Antitoxin n=1 Tax=Pelovirga terrestris TaxID=2771352 RepID=A0A8J6UHH5_9BACT|nr:type II toxin-antitoxin system Phd/YefM family antitoxin [Pelovirga terrestris]MBD1399315.1 type II toxin-antitoxin system Phd/YefM family antitoxin [Pelovirga terrestris]